VVVEDRLLGDTELAGEGVERGGIDALGAERLEGGDEDALVGLAGPCGAPTRDAGSARGVPTGSPARGRAPGSTVLSGLLAERVGSHGGDARRFTYQVVDNPP
jgi:hypothetical protein